jgi:hypothetical protein
MRGFGDRFGVISKFIFPYQNWDGADGYIHIGVYASWIGPDLAQPKKYYLHE